VTITAVALPSNSISAVPVTMPQSLNGVATLVTGGTTGFMHTQSTPSAQWVITIPSMGRLPNVAIYLTSGESVLTDFTVTNTLVTITFPSATAGYAVMT
jgi:hypothetical protein